MVTPLQRACGRACGSKALCSPYCWPSRCVQLYQSHLCRLSCTCACICIMLLVLQSLTANVSLMQQAKDRVRSNTSRALRAIDWPETSDSNARGKGVHQAHANDRYVVKHNCNCIHISQALIMCSAVSGNWMCHHKLRLVRDTSKSTGWRNGCIRSNYSGLLHKTSAKASGR